MLRQLKSQLIFEIALSIQDIGLDEALSILLFGLHEHTVSRDKSSICELDDIANLDMLDLSALVFTLALRDVFQDVSLL